MAYYQHNMLSIKSRTLLANILAEIVLLSESIQTYREALANIDYFDCIALFRFLDQEEKGYLRQKDFQRVIGTSHRKLLTYAFSWFDNMKVGEISRLQFSVFLLPKDNLQLRQLVAQRVQNPQISYSQHETILQQYQIFRNLVLQIMNKEMIIIQLRRKLIQCSDYTSKAAISAIDCSDHNWVVADDIFKFMKNYGFNVNIRHVQKLVEALNYNLDGKIVEEQLKWTIQGFQTNHKQYLQKIKSTNKKQHTMPSKSKLTDPKRNKKLQQQKDSQNDWKQLSQRFEMAVSSYNQVDKQLQQQQQIMMVQTNRKLQIKLHQHKQHQQIQLRKDREYEQRLIESYRYGQSLNRMKDHQNAMQELRRYQNVKERAERILQQDLRNIHQYNSRQNKNLYSFAEQSLDEMKARPYVTEAHVAKRDYANLTNLSNISIVESHRKTANMPQSQPSYQLIDSANYINAANSIKQKIKVERQIQKSIQDKFKNGQYNTSRFKSKASEEIHVPKVPQKDNKIGSFYKKNVAYVQHYNDNSFKNALGIQSKKKEDPKRYNYPIQGAIPAKTNKAQSILIKHQAAIYESPQKTQDFYRSGANKFTAATKAHESSQK